MILIGPALIGMVLKLLVCIIDLGNKKNKIIIMVIRMVKHLVAVVL